MPENKDLKFNRFFIGDEKSRSMTIDQVHDAKFNNQFAISVFSALAETGGKYPDDAVKEKYRERINNNQLPKSDTETGIFSNNLAKKIKCLIEELKKPGATELFTHSFFYQIIDRIRLGSMEYNSQEMWQNFKETAGCEDRYKGKDPLFASLLCHLRNPDRAIGLDFTKLIDCLMVPNGKGGYSMVREPDKRTKDEATQACKAYLKLLRENPAFTKNFEPAEPASDKDFVL